MLPQLPSFFEGLERDSAQLCISDLQLSLTTLEEVGQIALSETTHSGDTTCRSSCLLALSASTSHMMTGSACRTVDLCPDRRSRAATGCEPGLAPLLSMPLFCGLVPQAEPMC